MGRDALGLIAALLVGCPRASDRPPRMGDDRLLEVARACALRDYEGKGAAGCALVLDEATVDDVTMPDGAHAFRVEFTEERCGRPRYRTGLVLQIDDGGACTRVAP